MHTSAPIGQKSDLPAPSKLVQSNAQWDWVGGFVALRARERVDSRKGEVMSSPFCLVSRTRSGLDAGDVAISSPSPLLPRHVASQSHG